MKFDKRLYKTAPGVFVRADSSRARHLSNWLRQLSNPGRGFSSPLRECDMRKKSPHLPASSSLNDGGEGGLIRCAHPAGSPLTAFLVCPTGCASCRPPVGASHPPCGSATCEKKARICLRALLRMMAVRGGFEPPIRCRIHTFQACSFSHSDTSPHCLPDVVGTGANVGKTPNVVNPLFQ